MLILRVFISFTKQFYTFISRYFHISLGVVRSLSWGPRSLAVRRLPRMQEVVGSNPTERKICFSHFTLLEWNLKNCFVKRIKILKINRKNYFVWNDDILLKSYICIDKVKTPYARKINHQFRIQISAVSFRFKNFINE